MLNREQTMRGFVASSTVIVAAGLLIVFGGWEGAKSQERGPRVVLAIKARIDILHERQVAFDRPGVLAFVEPDSEGKMVEAKQIVARLRDEVARKTWEVADEKANNTVEIDYARAARAVALKDLEVAEKANRELPGAFEELEIQRMQLEVTRTGLQIKKAAQDQVIAGLERDQAQAELNQYYVEASVSGEVTKVERKSGDAVRQGDVVMMITDIGIVRAIGHVSAADIFSINKGDPVEVRIQLPDEVHPMEDEVFSGRITFVSPRIDRVEQIIAVHAEVANKTHGGKYMLREGMSIDMRILPR